MKTITSDFKEQITKLGREIDFQFFLHTNDKLITEDSKFIMTQANAHLVVEQFDDEEVDEIIGAEDIYSVSIINRGEILSTMMKELDFEIAQDLRIGDVIECQFGLKVGEDYEYVNYGKYMVYEKEYNEDTRTYSYIAYDRMMLTMQDASQEFLADLEGRTLANSINVICGKVGLSFNATQQELTDYPNLSKQINEGTFTNLQITYRDVLDMICQALGLSMIMNPNDKHLLLKPLNNTPVDTLDEQFLKDTNVSFGEKYGPINSVVLSRSEDFDNIYRRDEESIAENGLHEYKIKDNLIMLYDDREDYIDEIFEQLNGLEYYPTDFSSTGITYLDWLDFYNVTIGNKTYKCLMLDDEIEINQGLEENIYSEEPLETVTNYKTSSKTDKEVSFIVDKQNGSIKAKVSKGEVINEINLDESGAEINADKISLAGKEIKLTGDDITISSTNFNVDKNGNITANNATFNSGTFKGNINTSQNCTVGNNLYVGQNQSASNIDYKSLQFTDDVYLTRWIIDNSESLVVNGGSEIQFQTGGSAFAWFSKNGTTIQKSAGIYMSILGDGIHFSSQPIIDSDERLKQEIKNINTSWIDELKVKEFEYIKNPNKKQIGLIAQDYLDKDYSKYFLNQDDNGYYGITYGNITSALIQYCQEMKKEINSLKEEIKQLKESDK